MNSEGHAKDCPILSDDNLPCVCGVIPVVRPSMIAGEMKHTGGHVHTDKCSPDIAFEKYCQDELVQNALALDAERGKTLTLDLLRDCFMSGAKFASDRFADQQRAKATP